MRYVDGYVIPVPKKNLRAYRKISQKTGAIWKEYGALEYRECAGDDLADGQDDGPEEADLRFQAMTFGGFTVMVDV